MMQGQLGWFLEKMQSGATSRLEGIKIVSREQTVTTAKALMSTMLGPPFRRCALLNTTGGGKGGREGVEKVARAWGCGLGAKVLLESGPKHARTGACARMCAKASEPVSTRSSRAEHPIVMCCLRLRDCSHTLHSPSHTPCCAGQHQGE